MSAEIMPGYKQTELGIVPEDWQIQSLPEALQFISGKAHEQFINEAGPYVVVNSKFISTEGGVRKYSSENLCPAKRGDVLMVMSDLPNGRALAKCYLVREDKKYAVNQRVCIFRPTKGSSEYFYYFLNRNKYFMQFDDGVQQTHLLNPIILNCKLKVPPEPEQSRIGQALADIDSLISFLDQLIAKKRDIQQAAMQQLLTGQRRLPGFSGEWKVMRLGEICTMQSGEGITSANIDEHSAYPCYGGNGLRGQTGTYTHDGSYVLIGRQGALCGNITFAQGKFFASEHAIVVTPSGQADVSWLSIILRKMNLNQYSESSAQPGLSVVKLLLLPCLVPPQPEQTAIATILSDMDSELAALETRRDKARQLKQGMMQELLTGRIRLI